MKINFKVIKCPICDIIDYSVLYKSTLNNFENEHDRIEQFTYKCSKIKKLGQIVKCNKCDLIFVNPQGDNIEYLYSNSKDPVYGLSEKSRRETFEKDLFYIGDKRGKILDLGCSIGLFLDVAKKNGLDTYGVDLSKWACQKARNITRNIYNKKLKKCNFKDNFFDVITMWDLIEHLTNPNEELKEINRILKKDGKLIITTPNIDSFLSRLMKREWLAMIRMHLFYFSPKTISKILEKNGFEVIKIKSYSRTIILKYSIEWFKPYKYVYPITELIAKSILGKLKIRVNTGNTMVVFARKK